VPDAWSRLGWRERWPIWVIFGVLFAFGVVGKAGKCLFDPDWPAEYDGIREPLVPINHRLGRHVGDRRFDLEHPAGSAAPARQNPNHDGFGKAAPQLL
jgi:hypothetical protein